MLCDRNRHSIVGQLILKKKKKQTYKQTYRKRDQICGHVGERGLNESSQNVKTIGCKVNKY